MPTLSASMATKNLSAYDIASVPDASNMIFGVVVAEWNPEITGALLEGCVSTLEKHGALPENIHVKTVPGSFELIYGAHQMTLNDGYDAVIILGCVIRGETPHFDYICQGVTEGIARLNATSNIPVVYGLLTTNDLQQAKDRAGGRLGNKGDECAVVAIKMAKSPFVYNLGLLLILAVVDIVSFCWLPLVLEVSDACLDQYIVPTDAFLDVADMDAVAVPLGKDTGEVVL